MHKTRKQRFLGHFSAMEARIWAIDPVAACWIPSLENAPFDIFSLIEAEVSRHSLLGSYSLALVCRKFANSIARIHKNGIIYLIGGGEMRQRRFYISPPEDDCDALLLSIVRSGPLSYFLWAMSVFYKVKTKEQFLSNIPYLCRIALANAAGDKRRLDIMEWILDNDRPLELMRFCSNATKSKNPETIEFLCKHMIRGRGVSVNDARNFTSRMGMLSLEVGFVQGAEICKKYGFIIEPRWCYVNTSALNLEALAFVFENISYESKRKLARLVSQGKWHGGPQELFTIEKLKPFLCTMFHTLWTGLRTDGKTDPAPFPLHLALKYRNCKYWDWLCTEVILPHDIALPYVIKQKPKRPYAYSMAMSKLYYSGARFEPELSRLDTERCIQDDLKIYTM